MTSSYDTSWEQASSPWARKPTQKPVSMYSDPSQATANQPSAGMYSQAATPSGAAFSPLNFQGLSAGGSQDVTSGDTSIRSTGPDQTGMYQAFTNLLGTGLQTQAQQNVANTNIQPAMTKLGLQQNEYFPFLKQLLTQNGGLGGGGYDSTLTSSVLNASNPAYEQAAINAAEAAAARSAEQSKMNQYGQLAGVAGSPFRYALNAASNAASMAAGEEAKRKIRDDYAQRRVGNLASAISARSNAMNPIYSLFGQLLG